MSYVDGAITLNISGSYDPPNPLGNITIAGLDAQPPRVTLNGMALEGVMTTFSEGVLRLTGLDTSFMADGVFQQASYMTPVTEIADGQIQVPDGTQAAGGQLQATGGA